jgi:F-type H+-transporting ATPase subunit a
VGSLLASGDGEGFVPPGAGDFQLPPFFDSVAWLNKPVLQTFLAALLIMGFFWLATRRASIVPGRLQFAAEGVYTFVTRDLGRDILGSAEYKKFVPLLLGLFSFIAVNNVFGIVPLIQFPAMSVIGYPIALTLIVYVTYLSVGISRKGFFGYFKQEMFPPGVPWPVYFLLAPIELAKVLVVQPLTLSLRLFANMFAGHLLLLVFILGGEYMLLEGGNALIKVMSIGSFAMGIAMSFFELLIQILQAYIFTLLTALYIANAMSEEH